MKKLSITILKFMTSNYNQPWHAQDPTLNGVWDIFDFAWGNPHQNPGAYGLTSDDDADVSGDEPNSRPSPAATVMDESERIEVLAIEDSQPAELPMDTQPGEPFVDGPLDSPPDELPMDSQPDELPMDSQPDELPKDSQPDELPMDSQPDELPMDELPLGSKPGELPPNDPFFKFLGLP